jgi:hypothetical protein
MTGYYEVRVSGRQREQFRMFCLLDRDGPGLPGPAIAVVAGLRKRWMTKLSDAEYAAVREIGEEYKASSPRRIAS